MRPTLRPIERSAAQRGFTTGLRACDYKRHDSVEVDAGGALVLQLVKSERKRAFARCPLRFGVGAVAIALGGGAGGTGDFHFLGAGRPEPPPLAGGWGGGV